MGRLKKFAQRIKSFVLNEIAKMGESVAAAIDAHVTDKAAHVTAVERGTWAGACAVKPIIILATGWINGGFGKYTVYLDLTVSGITANDHVNVALSANALAVSYECGLCPAVESLDGMLRFRAVKIPSTAMTGVYNVLKEG